MKVIKKINNNVALCVDKKNNELIAFGKGIGFHDMPYEINDMTKIDRTFYCVNQNYISLINEIPEEVLKISEHILDYARKKIQHNINETFYFVLADHINFAINRAKENVYLQTGLSYEVQSYYPDEMEVGRYAINLINEKFKIHLLKDEASNIAIHIVESEIDTKHDDKSKNNEIVEKTTSIVENEFNITINKESFNYSRFVSHIQYLLLRQKGNHSIISENEKLFETISKEYPKSYECVLKIKEYFKECMNWDIGNEEMLYLMLHINRLCYREDCNQ